MKSSYDETAGRNLRYADENKYARNDPVNYSAQEKQDKNDDSGLVYRLDNTSNKSGQYNLDDKLRKSGNHNAEESKTDDDDGDFLLLMAAVIACL